jgi:hypothetical protein
MPEFNWKGEWLPNLPYLANIVVIYNNKNYISLNFVNASNIPPDIDTTNWELLIENIEPII